MRAALLLGTALALLAARAHADWASLWSRPDQQGERALRAGDAKRAAELFTDPRRQAYAELQAQQYAAAAQRLAPLDDAESQYNRGNALARGGDLKAALGAYDAALQHAELDPALQRDAQHNRELVAQQLNSQQKQSDKSDQQSNDKSDADDEDKQDGKQNKDNQAGDSQKSSKQSASNSTGSNGSISSGAASGQSQREDAHSQTGNENASAAASAAGSSQQTQQRSADNQNAGGGELSADGKNSDKTQKSGIDEQHPNGPKDEASLASTAQSLADGRGRDDASRKLSQSGTPGSALAVTPAGDALRPQTEQQLALEQWLRQVPDDPSGLLRRKFLVEHMMKQQQVQP